MCRSRATMQVTKLFQADPPLHQVINRNLEVGASGNKAYNLFNMSHNIDWSVSAYAGRNYNDIILLVVIELVLDILEMLEIPRGWGQKLQLMAD